MRDSISIGSNPAGEELLTRMGVDSSNLQRQECQAFITAIRRTVGVEVGTARLIVKSNPHDFGSYLTVDCVYDDQDEEGQEYAFRCECEAPEYWKDAKMTVTRHDDRLSVITEGLINGY